MTVILRYCGPFYDAPMHTFMFTEVTALVLELAKTARRLAVELAKFFMQNWFHHSDRENGPSKLKILVQVASCWISNWVTAPRLQHGWFGQGDSWSEAEVWSKAAGREI